MTQAQKVILLFMAAVAGTAVFAAARIVTTDGDVAPKDERQSVTNGQALTSTSPAVRPSTANPPASQPPSPHEAAPASEPSPTLDAKTSATPRADENKPRQRGRATPSNEVHAPVGVVRNPSERGRFPEGSGARTPPAVLK